MELIKYLFLKLINPLLNVNQFIFSKYYMT